MIQNPNPRTHSDTDLLKKLVLAGLLSTTASLTGQSLVTEYPAYFPDETFNVFFNGGPGNTKDWIGVYPEEVVPGSVGSTRWDYVDDTRNGTVGLKEGTVNLPGLALGGTWTAHFLLNDGYTILAQTNFTVLDPATPLVRLQRTVTTSQAFSVNFFNAPGNTKDWVGIYKEGQVPGAEGVSSTLWFYLDGTRDGNKAVNQGTLNFPTGLPTPGNWVTYLLENDGYTVLSSQAFVVKESAAVSEPRVLSISPAHQSVNVPPGVIFSANITNGTTKVVLNTIRLEFDDAVVAHSANQTNELIRVSFALPNVPPPNSTHRFKLSFKDSASKEISAESTFTIANYNNIQLPEPIPGTFENFDNIAEGEIPPNWTRRNLTEKTNDDLDFGNLDSAAFVNWTAIDVKRFQGSFVTYSNPDNADSWEEDYRRVLSENPMVVLNGSVLRGPLASGRMLFANSGYRNGRSQILYLVTRDYDLTGRSNVHVAFKSLWEQNQDSIASLEYSIDQGSTWLPIFYLLDNPDIVKITNETTGAVTVDAEATFNTEAGDIARYLDPDSGETLYGTYGSFIGAAVTPALAPFIQARAQDNPVDSKRVELYPVPLADNQKSVRFRFAHAGTDSWYWGLDDFGLYSIGTIPGAAPSLSIARTGAQVTISWPADASGYRLESSPTAAPGSWQPVPNVSGNTHSMSPGAENAFLRLRK